MAARKEVRRVLKARLWFHPGGARLAIYAIPVKAGIQSYGIRWRVEVKSHKKPINPDKPEELKVRYNTMSQYMQIDIKLLPFYEKPFLKKFRNIAELFKSFSFYEDIQKNKISLYFLIDYLVSMSRDSEIPKEVKKRISPFVKELARLKNMAREKLLARELNELDQILYKIEDQFEELEGSL